MPNVITTQKETIRKHLARIIHAGRNGDALPSENELCDLFNVARGTVRSATKELIESGDIIAKRGAGMFIHKKEFSFSREYNFGIIVGDGRQAFLQYFSGLICSSITREVCKSGHSCFFVENSGENNQWVPELVRSGQKGFFWLYPSISDLKQMVSMEVPVVVLGRLGLSSNENIPDKANAALIDEYKEGEIFAKHCLDKGMEYLVVIDPRKRSSVFFNGIQDELGRRGLNHAKQLKIIVESTFCEKILSNAISNCKCGIYCTHGILFQTHSFLINNGLSFGSDYVLLARKSQVNVLYPEIACDLLDCNLDKLGVLASQLLLDQIQKYEVSPEQIMVAPEICS